MDQMISDQIEKDLPNYSFGYGLHLQKAAFTGKETDDLVVWAAGNGTGIGASSLGFASSLYFVPNKKFAVGIVSNDGEYSYKKVVSKAFELFLGQDRQSVVISKSPPETWIKYTGVYYSVTYGDMIVSLVGERLWLEVPQLNFQTELIQNRDSTFIWAHLPESVLNQNHLTAAAYDANPIFSSSFLKKPGSTAEKTDFLVSRLVIGVRKQESCSHQIRAF
jgi:hypothetical protein